MLRSMTGYGSGQLISDGKKFTVEIKAVNHRYLDITVRAPRNCAFLEESLKKRLSGHILRGKVEVYVGIEYIDSPVSDIVVNKAVAGQYVKALREAAETFSLKDDLTVSALSRLPDIFSVQKVDVDAEETEKNVSAAADIAIASFVAMRTAEGANLKKDLLLRGDAVLVLVDVAEERSKLVVPSYMDNLKARMQELLGNVQINEERLLTEAALFADKAAVAEETVRLKSHVSQLQALVDSDGSVGKKLDFLVQEMNREANTIGSKANDIEITRIAMELKNEIEKIREQVQNVE